jgi:hypothetical protein
MQKSLELKNMTEIMYHYIIQADVAELTDSVSFSFQMINYVL